MFSFVHPGTEQFGCGLDSILLVCLPFTVALRAAEGGTLRAWFGKGVIGWNSTRNVPKTCRHMPNCQTARF